MYANLHTLIFHFTLIFLNNVQKDCKKGKTKTVFPFPQKLQKLDRIKTL